VLLLLLPHDLQLNPSLLEDPTLPAPAAAPATAAGGDGCRCVALLALLLLPPGISCLRSGTGSGCVLLLPPWPSLLLLP
jgi:hypothetical protein